jgi:hypothetical protein
MITSSKIFWKMRKKEENKSSFSPRTRERDHLERTLEPKLPCYLYSRSKAGAFDTLKDKFKLSK